MAAANDELAHRARKYDAMAVMHASVTFHDRRAFDSAAVRYLNNFVKACMVDAACRCLCRRGGDGGLRVAEVACGRGQDHSKWMYGCRAAGTWVSTYFGLDLSSADHSAALAMAAKFLGRHGAEVRIQTADMGVAVWDAPDGSADVVSCQLAMHYLWDAEDHASHFFQQAARVLDSAGLLLISYADGRSVVRRARQSAGAVRSRFYKLEVPAECSALRLKSPFGNRYVFTMPDSVESVPEYLCHEGSLLKLAKREGFVCGLSMYFDELALRLRKLPRFSELARRMGGDGLDGPDRQDALDAANLYRFSVLARTPAALQAFKNALSF